MVSLHLSTLSSVDWGATARDQSDDSTVGISVLLMKVTGSHYFIRQSSK